MTRVLLGVKQMNTEQRAEKVKALLLSLEGVSNVDAKADEQATVLYDEDTITVTEIILALRQKGLQAGMH